MFRNFLKITWLNIQKYRIYSFINILGLVIGLTICLVLGYYVVDDLTFDRFHSNADRIFRLITIESPPGQDMLTYSIITGPLLPAVKENIPEILGASRVYSYGNVRLEPPSAGSHEQEDASDVIRARSLVTDPGFFDVFDFKLLSGDSSALETTGIFLTPALAASLFGEENPIGKPLKVNSRDGYIELQPLLKIHLGSSHHRYDGLNRNKNNAPAVPCGFPVCHFDRPHPRNFYCDGPDQIPQVQRLGIQP